MLIEIIIGSLVLLLLVASYIIYNLLRKTEKLEDWILDARDRIVQVINDMRSIDSKEIFEKDDEVGSTFQELLAVVESLTELIVDDNQKTEEAEEAQVQV